VLLVVGGTRDMVRSARADVDRAGLADRVVFAGEQSDPVPFLHAADVLVLPSAYEANALVVLEALACGLPVVSTPVGFAPDVVVDGETGFIVDRTAASVGARLAELAAQPLDAWRERARRAAEQHSWREVGRRYLELVHALEAENASGATGASRRPARDDPAGESR
jgi:UDP-glucose:(heptosyl)LPS alpha-1,3-glucosyltransferase